MTDRQLDIQYTPLIVTTPVGVGGNSPQVTAVNLGDVHLVAVHIRIPPGHGGLTGVAVKLDATVIVPWGPTYLIGDDEHLRFDVGIEVDRGLVVETFNQGTYPHSHHMRFEWRALPAAGSAGTVAPLRLIDPAVLSA